MQDLDDQTLLRRYVDEGLEEAFAALVTRHVNKVYSVALRHTRNPHSADEITQAVFVILAKKARAFGSKVILSGWLYETARLTSVTFIRSEIRRARREQEAYMQTSLNETNSDLWPQIAPLLDNAMAGLSEKDRHAVVLRYFDGKSLREVGETMGVSEDAAKTRLSRSVEKLRRFMTRRGVVLSAVLLTTTISSNSVQAAPVALAKTATATALDQGVAVSASTSTMVKGALKFMAWSKIKMAMVFGARILLIAGVTTIAIKANALFPAYEGKMYLWRTDGIKRETITNFETWPKEVWIRPAKNLHLASQLNKNSLGGLMGRNTPFSWLIRNAYGENHPWLVISDSIKDEKRYDYVANVGPDSMNALQEEINKTFHVVVHKELRETNVLIFKVLPTGAKGLLPPTGGHTGTSYARNNIQTWYNQPLSTLDTYLEYFFKIPIIDQTGLTNKYEFSLQWDDNWWRNHQKDPEGLIKIISQQLGLELIPSRQPIEMLVVESVN